MPTFETPDRLRRHDPAPPPRPDRARTMRRLEVSWADSEDDVRAAQRLRHRVFAIEMGATLEPPRGTPPGHDADRFDPWCDHAVVRAIGSHGRTDVIGTYRVMTPDAARRAGGCYSDTEFDLRALSSLRPRMLELGRSCIDPAWRTGGAILMLWGAIGDFMTARGLDICFGAASIPLHDGGRQARSVWNRLARTRLAPPERRVRPWRPLPAAPLDDDAPADDAVEMPALVKGYARCGAELLGPPAWDPAFGCADLPMLMPLDGLPDRHRRRFLGEDSPSAVTAEAAESAS